MKLENLIIGSGINNNFDFEDQVFINYDEIYDINTFSKEDMFLTLNNKQISSR